MISFLTVEKSFENSDFMSFVSFIAFFITFIISSMQFILYFYFLSYL